MPKSQEGQYLARFLQVPVYGEEISVVNQTLFCFGRLCCLLPPIRLTTLNGDDAVRRRPRDDQLALTTRKEARTEMTTRPSRNTYRNQCDSILIGSG